MKRLYTAAMAIATVVTALAVTPMQGKFAQKSAKQFEGLRPTTSKVLGQHAHDKSAPMLKAPSRSPETPDNPADMLLYVEGRHEQMSVLATQFINTWYGMQYTQMEYPAEVVWAEDGTTVYIRDIISSLPSGVYVKGEYADGKVTVKLPQYCYYEDDIDEEGEYQFAAFYASKMEYYEDDIEGYMNVAEEDNYVVYTVGEDGSLTLDLNDGDPDPLEAEDAPMYIIGICEDTTAGIDDWLGFGEAYQTFTKFDLEPNAAPEDVVFEDWAMLSNEIAMVQVGIKDGIVYIKGLSEEPDLAEITLIGTIEGDKVVFECPQYLGVAYDYFLYFMACEWTDDTWEDYELLDKVEMSYDAEGKVLTEDNPLIDYLVNIGTSGDNPLLYFEHPTFLYQTDEDTNADPEDPYVTYFEEYQYRDYMDASEGYIEWVIPATNVKGFLLYTENMYYNFLINGEIMTFTVDDYPFFDEDLTDIPYDFEEGFDLQAQSDTRYFTYKRADAKTFGLQSFYIGTDGETYKSALVTYEPELSGIISMQAKSVKAVELYNLQGQRVTNPSSGIYIMRSIYEDGTCGVCKISKK